MAADKAAAEAAILKLSDFPAGWTSKPPSASIGNASIDTQLGIISSDRSASYIQAVYNAVGGLRRQLAREPIVP